MSRKGRAAAPAISAAKLKMWGRCAPLSRHKAAPTGIVAASGIIVSAPENIPHLTVHFRYSTRRSFSGPQNQVVQILRVQLRLHVR
ncbi:hypothetical protein DMX12_27360 [Pseudomonas sp. MB-090624]|nr:hypothetical protein DMX12_27360 [Pseudomonas sp. MB-090624]